MNRWAILAPSLPGLRTTRENKRTTTNQRPHPLLRVFFTTNGTGVRPSVDGDAQKFFSGRLD